MMPDVQTPQTNPATPPPAPQKTRRVGTFTMALCLIAAGVLLLVHIFVPSLDVVQIFRFTPVVLILLGIEILIANFTQKDEKLTYDFLSVLLCILLIGASLVAAIVPALIRDEREANAQSQVLSQEFSDRAYAALQGRDDISSIDTYVSISTANFENGLSLDNLRAYDYVQAMVTFTGEFDDMNDFTRACHEVLQTLKDQVVHIDYVSFHSSARLAGDYDNAQPEPGEENYSLWLNGNYQMNWTATEMAQNAQVYRWWQDDEGGFYVTFEEYEYREEQRNNMDDLDDTGNEPSDDVSDIPDADSADDVSEPESVPDAA